MEEKDKPVVSVASFGAIGDGKTDDTAALQKAIHSAQQQGSDLSFGTGTYLISKQLQFLGWKNANVLADKATIIASDHYQRTYPLEGMLEFQGAENVKVTGLTIDGNEQAFPDAEMFIHALRFKNSNRVEVSSITTRNTVGNGLNFADTDNPRVHHNTISTYWHGGIEFKRNNNIYVADNTITGTGDKGTTAAMQMNRRSSGTSGILITGTATGGEKTSEPPHRGAVVERNIIRNSAGGGIKIEDQNDVKVLNNQVHTFGKDGIKVHPINPDANPKAYVTDAVIRGNTVSGFENWRGDGSGYIVLQSVRGGVVEDNLILGNGSKSPAIIPSWKYEYGVRVNPFLDWGKAPTNITVRNNRIYATKEPIALEGRGRGLKAENNTITAEIPEDFKGSIPALPPVIAAKPPAAVASTVVPPPVSLRHTIAITASQKSSSGLPEFAVMLDGKTISFGNVVRGSERQTFHFVVENLSLEQVQNIKIRLTNAGSGGKTMTLHRVILNGIALGQEGKVLDDGTLVQYRLTPEARQGRGELSFKGTSNTDVFVGSSAKDVIPFTLGSGRDMVLQTSPQAAALDIVQLGTGIAASQVRFWRQEGDLFLGLSGTKDTLCLKDWYSGNMRLKEIQLENGRALAGTDIQQLVDAMHDFTPPKEGEDVPSLAGNILSVIEGMIAALWK